MSLDDDERVIGIDRGKGIDVSKYIKAYENRVIQEGEWVEWRVLNHMTKNRYLRHGRPSMGARFSYSYERFEIVDWDAARDAYKVICLGEIKPQKQEPKSNAPSLGGKPQDNSPMISPNSPHRKK